MSFYNRLAEYFVSTFIDSSGIAHPLDVVPYGGASRAFATIGGSQSAVILGTPPAGRVYRLHRWTGGLVSAGAPGGIAELSDSVNPFDFVQCATVATNSIGFGSNLDGQIASVAISITNLFGTSCIFGLSYDLIDTPAIA